MSEPTKKSTAINKIINSMLPEGVTREGSILKNICAWCGKPAPEFRDALSAREFRISGLCQTCQDEAFGLDENA